ncbi:MAG: hypothetical protein Q7S18_02385 [bacterium]|nr:hypothetical protein [bacterium]
MDKQTQQTQQQNQQNQTPPQQGQAPKADPQDVEKNKALAILAYIIFFIPLIAAKDSKFAMYHTNQGLVLFLAAIALNIAGSIIPVLGWFIILPFGWIFILVAAIMGIISAFKGEMKPLPIIGGIQIIK